MPRTDISARTDRRRFVAALGLAALSSIDAGATSKFNRDAARNIVPPRIPAVVFDVNETLLDFNVLAPVFASVFGDAGMLRVWFNQVILYAEALTFIRG